jgi:hypothetical protein
MHAIASPRPARAPTARKVIVRLTVEIDGVTRVRQALIAACGDSVELLRTQIVPRSSQVRLMLVLAEGAVDDAMLAVMRTVPCGEIGPIIQQLQIPERRR